MAPKPWAYILRQHIRAKNSLALRMSITVMHSVGWPPFCNVWMAGKFRPRGSNHSVAWTIAQDGQWHKFDSNDEKVLSSCSSDNQWQTWIFHWRFLLWQRRSYKVKVWMVETQADTKKTLKILSSCLTCLTCLSCLTCLTWISGTYSHTVIHLHNGIINSRATMKRSFRRVPEKFNDRLGYFIDEVF